MKEDQPKKAVLIIAKEIFRDEELFDTQKALEAAGVQTVVASSKLGTCTGKLGATAEATMLVSDISADNFDAIVYVGGGGSAEFFGNPDALALAKDAAAKGKILAAICIAPRTLANAGLLKGIKATCFESERGALIKLGADFQDVPVARDGNIITASGPHAAAEFGHAIAQALGLD
jgi:protease I